jgi:anti-sigma factor RsiW
MPPPVKGLRKIMSAENITRENLNDFLVAYVDGELSAGQMRRIDDLLNDDTKAQRLRDILRSQTETLKGLQSGILDLPVPPQLIEAIRSRSAAAQDTELRAMPDRRPETRRPAAVVSSPSSRSGGSMARLWLVAASVAFLVIGAAGGFVAGGRYGGTPVAQADWLSQVADYHGIYAREQRHLVEVSAEETPHIEAWLGKRLARNLVVPDLSRAGAVFKGARLLGINGRPVAQLIYQPADGQPFALCVMASAKGDLAPVSARRADLNMIEWRQGGYAYVVVGWEDDSRLRGFVEPARESLDL